jgi:gluconokinase
MQILRAWLEAGAFAIGEIAAAVETGFGPPRQILAGGGALHGSPAWLQIIADVLGSPVHLSAIRETSARGAALLALERLGLVDDAFEVPSLAGLETLPDMDRHTRYRAARDRQRMLEQQLLPVMARGVQPRHIPRFD